MGQSKSRSLQSTLHSNSWRRLSDSDCLHLLSHPEYFDNQLLNIEHSPTNTIHSRMLNRTGSISTFFDQKQTPPEPRKNINCTKNVVLRSISMSSSTGPNYRNSMYPACLQHHQDLNSLMETNKHNTIQQNNNGFNSTVKYSNLITTSNNNSAKHTQHDQPSSTSSNTLAPLMARIRPISMFSSQFDPNSNPTDNHCAQTTSLTTTLTPIQSTLKEIENLNLSLNDLLEEVNTTEMVVQETARVTPTAVRLRREIIGENDNDKHRIKDDDEEHSGQTLVSKHVQSDDDVDDMDNMDSMGHIRATNTNSHSQHAHKRAPSATIRCSGLDCMCDRCIQNRFKLLNWLLPNCTRMNSERLLSGKPDGTFLVRKSEKFPGQYTLSFVCRRAVRHCLIMRSVYGFGLRWPYSFETLQQVIIHYSRHSLTEFNSKLNIHLKYPVFSA